MSRRTEMKEAFGSDCGIRLRHCLASAEEIQRRVIVNGELTEKVAKSLQVPLEQVRGAVRLLKRLPFRPSPERLALVVMRDYGLDNRDIAEIFGRSVRWATLVRINAEEIREAEPIAYELEFLDDGLRPTDPPPDEVLEQATALRESGIYRTRSPRQGVYANALI
jgi:hypothetical protein